MAAKVFKAQLEPSGREFSLDSADSVLNYALRQRVPIRYGCRNGRCLLHTVAAFAKALNRAELH